MQYIMYVLYAFNKLSVPRLIQIRRVDGGEY